MMIDLNNSTATTAAASSAVMQPAIKAGANGTDFRDALANHLQDAVAKVDSRQDKAKKAARQFVSSAFIMPLLKQMRQSPFKSKLFAGGKGEDAFGPQLDQILSDRIVKRMSTPEKIASSGSATQSMSLVDAVYRKIMRTAQSKATGTLHTAEALHQESATSPAATKLVPEMDLHG